MRFQLLLKIALIASPSLIFAQKSSTDPMFEGKIIGGKAVLEQVIQTQFELPKTFQHKSLVVDVVCYFALDSAGRAWNFNFDGQIPHALKPEIIRLFSFLKFQRSLDLPNEERPYFLKFDMNFDRYKNLIKQRSKQQLKTSLPADSSMLIYNRADRSPLYFKNGEQGFQDYILSEIEYPKVAIERSIEGTVILDFIVECNGFVTGIDCKKGVNGGCTEEAIRLIKSTFWSPAELQGKRVRYRMTLPITFSLRNVNKSNESSNSTFGQ